MPAKVIFLTSGTSWTVPSDWNSADNTIEMVDGGGGSYLSDSSNRVGGTGGSYRRYVNIALTPGAAAAYVVGAGGALAGGPSNGGTSSHTGCTTPTLTRVGGAGSGASDSNNRGYGGGAGGPNSAGSASSGDAPGSAGTGSWTSTHSKTGSVSVATAAPGAGGAVAADGELYGGGGGAAWNADDGWTGANGAQGIIVVTYTPPNVQSGTGAASGAAIATGVGRAIKAGVGSSAGVASVAGVGVAHTTVPTGFAAGTSTANAPGMAIAAGVGSAAGVATALAPTVFYAVGVGTAAGRATVHGAHYKPSRIIVGRLPSDAYGMRVSVPGYDASTHPVDDQKLIFSSEWPDVMPIHARGSFVHRGEFTQGNTETQEIDMPNPLGYVPFCDFTVRGMGNAAPAGTDLYPADRYYPYSSLDLPYWDGSGNVTTSGDANAYLRLNVTATKICARSFVRWITNSSTQGVPRQWVIYYTIYRKQAS